jgi:HD-GYP domain-containing protein (c-di-GMP phosphodiesterase class II)
VYRDEEGQIVGAVATVRDVTEHKRVEKALSESEELYIDNAMLFNDLQKTNIDLIQAYDNTLEGWSNALDLRDKETEGHSQRVTEMTFRLARQMGVRGSELVHVRRGALLHDIGKMGIPCCHHEKWDGTGYPRGLKGKYIPLAARVFSLVDVWDALRSERPYRPGWPESKGREYIKKQSGKQFDPKVVEVFLEHLKSRPSGGSGGSSRGRASKMLSLSQSWQLRKSEQRNRHHGSLPRLGPHH